MSCPVWVLVNNSGPLEVQDFLTTEPSLQPLKEKLKEPIKNWNYLQMNPPSLYKRSIPYNRAINVSKVLIYLEHLVIFLQHYSKAY